MTFYNPLKTRWRGRSAAMPTLGEELKRRREQRGITLAEIAEATRIGTRFLKAIETDSFSILPGGIFTRSFIRAYAKHVGMNEDEAIVLYLQQVSGTDSEEQEPALDPASKQTDKATRSKGSPHLVITESSGPRLVKPRTSRAAGPLTHWPSMVIGGVITIIAVIVVVVLMKQLNQGSAERTAQTASGAQTSPSTGGQATAPTPSESPKPPSEQRAAPVEVPAGQPLVVKIEAVNGDSWIGYQVDDSKLTSFTLKQGESRDLPPAQSEIALNYGNRLVLKLTINNRDASFPADAPKFGSKVMISRDNFQTFFQ